MHFNHSIYRYICTVHPLAMRLYLYLFRNYLEEELKCNTMNNIGINLTYKYLKHNRFDDTFDLTVL